MLSFLPPEIQEQYRNPASEDLPLEEETGTYDLPQPDPEPEPEPEPVEATAPEVTPESPKVEPQALPQNEALKALQDRLEALGTKNQLRDGLLEAFKNKNTTAKALQQVDAMAEGLGATREEVLGVLGIKAKAPRAPRDPDAPVRKRAASQDPDDPNSPNYRFRDTGHVPGSRKELAADVIRRAGRDGHQLKASEIDWEAIERNPRLAKALITKSNLFGTVDWSALRETGLEPGAGFLIDRVYASVGKEPTEDSPAARHDYSVGLDLLRDRLEACKTPDDVTKALDGLRDEFEGISLNETERNAYDAISEAESRLHDRYMEFQHEDDRLANANIRSNHAVDSANYEQTKRLRRGWKPDPEISAKIGDLKAEQEKCYKALEDFRNANPYFKRDFTLGRFSSPYSHDRDQLRNQRLTILAEAKIRNQAENPFHRGLKVMGDRFINVLNYRRNSGSDAFANHVATAKAGKIRDWDWAEKEGTTVDRSTKESVRFQLKVADRFERVGGREIPVESTEDLKAHFNLREIQSGNYVLQDYNAARFHVLRCAEAYADLADLIGVPDKKISMNGELAMAFGARGAGNAGWRGAAAASYTSIYRIINLTKAKGGGCLAHEWFHGLDNLSSELETGTPATSDDFVTERPDLLPEGRLKASVKNLMNTMLTGEHRLYAQRTYTGQEFSAAKRELTGYSSRQGTRAAILSAGSAEKALDAIRKAFPVKTKDELAGADRFAIRDNRRNLQQRKAFETIAVAWYGGNPEGGAISVPITEPMSSFALEATKLDGGSGTYWAKPRELAARAFHAFVEDRLRDRGRQCDYLAAYGDNKYYRDPIFGDKKPYPEGEERERINAAFDEYIEALRESKFAN